MVDDHPVLTILHEGEAIACGQSLGFPVLDVRERVVAGVDGGTAINADQLLAERHLETRQHPKRRDEVVAQRCSIRHRAPPRKLERTAPWRFLSPFRLSPQP